MKKSPMSIWTEIRKLVATLPEARTGMKNARTDPMRDAFTQDYVGQTDQLVGLMIELDQTDVLADLEGCLEVQFGRVG